MSIYENDAVVGALTNEVIGKGHRVFQIYKTGDDSSHVRYLLDLFDLPYGATVLDAGCGIGEVSRLMKKARPDLEFVLLNVSAAQLSLCPGYQKLHASFESIPLPASSVDGVMFNYALGHGDIDNAFAEAARVVKPSGPILVYDMEGDREALDYKIRPSSEVLAAATRHGLECTVYENPKSSAADFMSVMAPADFAATFGDVRPVLYRLVRLP